jgi:hypothetical protein
VAGVGALFARGQRVLGLAGAHEAEVASEAT